MKIIIMSAIAAMGTSLCGAQEVGRVLSSTPVVQQVQIPRQVCSQDSWQSPAQKSGAGAAIGAIAGGAIGNAIGHGGGRAAATAIGIFGGAVLGDNIEGAGASQAQTVQRCSTQMMLENRVVAYQVVYEYAGKQFSVQMPNDPGPQVQLQITPVGALPPAPPANPVVYTTPATPPVVVSQPVYITSGTYWYPAPMPYAYRPPVHIDLRLGHAGRGYAHGHRHGHWR